MVFKRDSGNYEIAGGSNAATHILSDEIQLVSEIDDLLLMNIVVDGLETLNLPDGWTEFRAGVNNGIGYAVFWKLATEQNEPLPSITVNEADTLSCEAVSILGIDTSNPIGASVENDGKNATPTWLSLTPQAINSTILYLGGMDADTMLSVGNSKNILEISDALGNSSIMGYEFKPDTLPTGECVGSASADDGWQTVTVPRIPTYFSKQAGATIDGNLYTGDVDIRDFITDKGVTLEGNSCQTNSFDSGNDIAGTVEIYSGTGITYAGDDEIRFDTAGFDFSDCTVTITSGDDQGTYNIVGAYIDVKIFLDTTTTADDTVSFTIQSTNVVDMDTPALMNRRSVRLSGDTPDGLVAGEYYHMARRNANQVTFFPAGSSETFLDGAISISATSGTCTVTECGMSLIPEGTDNDYDKPDSHFNTGDNYQGSAKEFTTPYDLTGKIIGRNTKWYL